MKHLDLILDAANKIRRDGDKVPYAVFCNKNTYELLKKQASSISNKKIRTLTSLCGLKVEINNYIDETRIVVVDKKTYEAIMSKDIEKILERLRGF